MGKDQESAPQGEAQTWEKSSRIISVPGERLPEHRLLEEHLPEHRLERRLERRLGDPEDQNHGIP